MSAEYPYAQWFEDAPACQKCGKPAGKLRDHRNGHIANLCKRHGEAAVKASHRSGDFLPDAVLKDTRS